MKYEIIKINTGQIYVRYTESERSSALVQRSQYFLTIEEAEKWIKDDIKHREADKETIVKTIYG